MRSNYEGFNTTCVKFGLSHIVACKVVLIERIRICFLTNYLFSGWNTHLFQQKASDFQFKIGIFFPKKITNSY